jgi:hypothetical protein
VPTSLLLIAGFLIFLDKILKCAFESESNWGVLDVTYMNIKIP